MYEFNSGHQVNINKIHTLFLIWLFAAVALISVIVPPMQSPDESEHIVRAYLLGRGGIVLDAPAGNSSGGLIDLNLDKYIRAYSVFPFHPERKLSLNTTQEAESLRWSEEKSFRPALGMAYYFPVIYAPHAFGLGLGELLGLSIDHSYRLTRAILLGLTCLILFWSFRLHAPNYLVLLFLVMPMSIFQFASASLDGIATAFAILIISLFLKNITSEVKKPIGGGFFSIALLIWIILASSRLQLLPLILLLTGIGYLSRRWSYIFWCVVACALVLAWQVVALRTVVDGRIPSELSSGQILLYYLENPEKIFRVFVTTLSDLSILKGYLSSFYGMLGWLDTPFYGAEYKYFLIVTVCILAMSIDFQGIRTNVGERLLLTLVALGSLAITFLAMLVTWTPHPAIAIDGVQGRYLLVPAILVAYAIGKLNINTPACNERAWAGHLGLIGLGIISSLMTANLLLERYYILP